MGLINTRRKLLVGKVNESLFRDLFRATKAADFAEVERLKATLKKSQEECLHPSTEHRTAKSIPGGPTKRYKKGDCLSWCFRCGKILEHNGKEVGEELPLTVWERLLDGESPFDEAGDV